MQNYIKKIQHRNLNKNKGGFALLFSVLLASFLITLGISIFSISLKEIQIATSARDSQIAYYVADSARECALYWDVKKGAFPTFLSGTEPYVENTVSSPVTCNNFTITLPFTRYLSTLTYSANAFSFFLASSTSSSTPVADLNISKTFNKDTLRVVTTIKAYGHNTGILGRRVERGIQQINN